MNSILRFLKCQDCKSPTTSSSVSGWIIQIECAITPFLVCSVWQQRYTQGYLSLQKLEKTVSSLFRWFDAAQLQLQICAVRIVSDPSRALPTSIHILHLAKLTAMPMSLLCNGADVLFAPPTSSHHRRVSLATPNASGHLIISMLWKPTHLQLQLAFVAGIWVCSIHEIRFVVCFTMTYLCSLLFCTNICLSSEPLKGWVVFAGWWKSNR